ncbi:hypothetical protein DVH24_017426 [Malus domestica]|uniref:Uncharacterized protein n=1 Tax=Malus domestica TaxID=3750 RepID=A0A498IY26_MALDO|nr:hypothetical protein DVH24_017426 [Malus domestica]
MSVATVALGGDEFRIEIETKTGRGPRSSPPPPSSCHGYLPPYRIHGGGGGNENFGFAEKRVFERE